MCKGMFQNVRKEKVKNNRKILFDDRTAQIHEGGCDLGCGIVLENTSEQLTFSVNFRFLKVTIYGKPNFVRVLAFPIHDRHMT